jgi:PadR family transcriptional regulator, regulatory protein PadR
VNKEQDGWASQLRKGVIELAVLGLLAREPKYGSQLVEELAARPELAITAGTVYPLVARLAKAGLVTSTWQESPVGPPAQVLHAHRSRPRSAGRHGHDLRRRRGRGARDR